MAEIEFDRELLQRFEDGLDPRHPEQSSVPARVLGYGEISTVLELEGGALAGRVVKRMPMFRSEPEAADYERLYRESIRVLRQEVGLRVIPSEFTCLVNARSGRTVGYIIQEKVLPGTLGKEAIHRLPPAEVERLVLAVLAEIGKVFAFNQANRGRLEVGFDGQISNWAIDRLGSNRQATCPA